MLEQVVVFSQNLCARLVYLQIMLFPLPTIRISPPPPSKKKNHMVGPPPPKQKKRERRNYIRYGMVHARHSEKKKKHLKLYSALFYKLRHSDVQTNIVYEKKETHANTKTMRVHFLSVHIISSLSPTIH